MNSMLAAPPLDKSAPSIQGMFGRIAPRYDILNHLLSGGMDFHWRRVATDLLAPLPGERILDLGSGTGDLALALSRRSGGRARVAAADFTLEMLALGRRKFRQAGSRIPGTGADGLRLPFPPAAFDAVAAAFSLRNFEDLGQGLLEIHRILKPAGRFLILEFTPEPAGPLRPLILFYCRRILPALGRIVSNDRHAYQYLPDSVGRWPDPAGLSSRLEEAGFTSVRVRRLPFGIAVIHLATKASG